MNSPRLVDSRHFAALMRYERPEYYITQKQKIAPPFGLRPVKTIINLEQGWFEVFHDEVYEEDEWAEKLKLTIKHIPLSSIRAPTRTEVDDFLYEVSCGLNKGSVLFHCKKGKDRTGFMAATYRMRCQQWSKEEAVDEMIELGFNTTLYSHWIQHVGSGR